AAGLPAIGTIGEPGPQEIARAGEGIRLVPPADVEALARELDRLLAEPNWLADLGAKARATVESAFTWQRCGAATVAAYQDALWGELMTPAHLLARPLMAAIYRDADAVVAYGPHVAGFAARHGARRVHIAPQAVDNAFWSAASGCSATARDTAFMCLFVGRGAWEKGVWVLRDAWRASGLESTLAALV